MLDVSFLILSILTVSNTILSLYLIFLIRYNKKVAQKALSLANAKSSVEKMLNDMSQIISETTDTFEYQTNKVKDQVNSGILQANITLDKLNSLLNNTYSDFSTKDVPFIENSKSYVMYRDSIIDGASNKNSNTYDEEINQISLLASRGLSTLEIANKLHIKEKKVRVILNSMKKISL